MKRAQIRREHPDLGTGEVNRLLHSWLARTAHLESGEGFQVRFQSEP